MNKGEWDFTEKTGVTFVHIEMEEVTGRITAISDEEAEKTLAELMKRSGKPVADKKALVYMAKVCMATKETIAKYHLTSVAAECYPNYGSLMSLVPFWMVDEGMLADTKGDLGHAFVINTLNQLVGDGMVALSKAGNIDIERSIVPVAHEGSTAMPPIDSLDRAQINPSGELGTLVGVPHRTIGTVTVSAIVGSDGNYKMFVARGRTLPVVHGEWVEGDSKLLVNLRFDTPAQSVIDQLIKDGIDHYSVIEEGDYTKELSVFCDYMGFDQLLLK